MPVKTPDKSNTQNEGRRAILRRWKTDGRQALVWTTAHDYDWEQAPA